MICLIKYIYTHNSRYHALQESMLKSPRSLKIWLSQHMLPSYDLIQIFRHVIIVYEKQWYDTKFTPCVLLTFHAEEYNKYTWPSIIKVSEVSVLCASPHPLVLFTLPEVSSKILPVGMALQGRQQIRHSLRNNSLNNKSVLQRNLV